MNNIRNNSVLGFQISLEINCLYFFSVFSIPSQPKCTMLFYEPKICTYRNEKDDKVTRNVYNIFRLTGVLNYLVQPYTGIFLVII